MGWVVDGWVASGWVSPAGAVAVAPSPTAFDVKFGNLALRMIQKYGKTLLHSVAPADDGTFDPETGEVTVADATGVTVKGIIAKADQYRVDGVNVEASDRFILVARRQCVPKTGDRFFLGYTSDYESVNAVNVAAIYSGELVAAYEVQVR